jgi:hypothetical protein
MLIQHDNIALIGLPEGAKNISVTGRSLFYKNTFGNPAKFVNMINLPPGSWKFIGIHSKSSPLTEEQCEEVVPTVKCDGFHTPTYKDYVKGGQKYVDSKKGEKGEYIGYDNARESFDSLLKHVGAYLENEHEPEEDDFLLQPTSRQYDREMFLKAHEAWHTAQQRVFSQWAVVVKQ